MYQTVVDAFKSTIVKLISTLDNRIYTLVKFNSTIVNYSCKTYQTVIDGILEESEISRVGSPPQIGHSGRIIRMNK